jgi:hypothetical protein
LPSLAKLDELPKFGPWQLKSEANAISTQDENRVFKVI